MVPGLEELLTAGVVELGGNEQTVAQSLHEPDLGYKVSIVQSWRQILDVSDWDASLGSLPGGQSENPTSPHYNDLLGMKLIRKRDYPTGKFTLAFVGYGEETDSTVIELTHNWGQEEPYSLGSGFGHLAIGGPDVYMACEALGKVGVTIPRPAGPMAHGGSVIAFIEDPDGYKIELIQRA